MKGTTMEKHAKSVFRVVINAPIDKVWAELTRDDVLLPFFFNSRYDTVSGLRKGAPFRMISRDGKYTSVVGEVLEFDPPHRYVHTLRFTSLDDPPCKVTYELKQVDGGVEFTLINEQVPLGTKTEKYVTQGGQFIVDNLKAVVETGSATLGGRALLALIGAMSVFNPKSMRTENWPLEPTSGNH